MDPNATLAELREWVRETLDAGALIRSEYRAAELFDALNQWLSSGGFLPEAWKR